MARTGGSAVSPLQAMAINREAEAVVRLRPTAIEARRLPLDSFGAAYR
jgi:hypothetical protein